MEYGKNLETEDLQLLVLHSLPGLAENVPLSAGLTLIQDCLGSAFLVAAPKLWNPLLREARFALALLSFCRQAKTFFFKQTAAYTQVFWVGGRIYSIIIFNAFLSLSFQVLFMTASQLERCFLGRRGGLQIK